MLVINNYIDEDFANKYNKQQGVYPYYAISSIELGFRSSESTNPPVLIYNIGSRPPAPVLTAPLPWTVVNKTDTGSIVFEWQSEDQVARIIEYSQDNGLTWIADEAITQDKTFTLTTAELGYGNLLVRVKSKNSTGLYSDYSNQLYMQIGERPGTPVISITGANTATPKATWATDPRQYGYQAQVYKGVDIIEDGGEVSGNINSYSIKTRLENNQTYTIKARIRDQYGIWSNYGSTDILVSFLTPPQPQISVFPQYPRA
jgi:hypothetical protein